MVLATLIATNQSPNTLPPELGYLASRMRYGERVHISGQDLRVDTVIASIAKQSPPSK